MSAQGEPQWGSRGIDAVTSLGNVSLAVVILTWNRLELIQRYLPGVVRSWSQPGVAIIVADNGSTDGTVEWVETEFPDVLVILLGVNYGFAEGYQRALALVRDSLQSPYYLLLNNDVRVEDNFIPSVLDLFEGAPSVGALAPMLLSDRDPSSMEYAGAAGGFLDRFGYPFCRGRLLDTVEPDRGQYSTTIETHWASGACLFTRASSYWAAGGLEARFFAHMEEIDLCWRIRRMGYRVLCLGRERVFHLGGGTLGNESPRKLYFNYRNSLFMLRRNLPPKRRFLLRIRYLLDALSAVVYLLRGKPALFMAVIRAYRDYWRQRAAFKYERFPDEQEVSLAKFSLLWQYFVRRRRIFSALPRQDASLRNGVEVD